MIGVVSNVNNVVDPVFTIGGSSLNKMTNFSLAEISFKSGLLGLAGGGTMIFGGVLALNDAINAGKNGADYSFARAFLRGMRNGLSITAGTVVTGTLCGAIGWTGVGVPVAAGLGIMTSYTADSILGSFEGYLINKWGL